MIMRFLYIFFILFLFTFSSIKAQIFFSEYSEGSSYNKYIEIYNYSSETISLYPQFVLASCTNGCLDGNNFFVNEFPEGASIAPGDVYVIAANQADPEILNEADYTFQYCCGNGDDAYALMLSGVTGDVFDSNNALDIIGDEDTWQEGFGWDVAGVEQATKNHTLVRKSSVVQHNAGDWSMSAGTNSDNSEWIVLEIDDWTNLGYHVYDNNNTNIFGCTDPTADNFNPNATIDDDSCEYADVFGCTDSFATNFNPNATVDDGSCIYVEVSGCYWCELAANYFDFIPQVTSSNMTIAISDFSNLMQGDVVGVFYVDFDGYINCGGSSIFEGTQMAISAWGDDPSTFIVDGFTTGDSFIFLVFREGVVYETNITMNTTAPFTNIYGTNSFGQVENLVVANEFIENCVLPTGSDEDCNEFFDIPEGQMTNKNLILTIDLLGRVIYNDNDANFKIRVYDNGIVKKQYLLNH